LLKSLNSDLNPLQIRSTLKNSAIDIQAGGVDRDSGVGIVMALAALQSVSTTPTFTLSVQSGGANQVFVTSGTLDIYDRNSGTTPFTLVYNQGANVVLYAPLQVGGQSFSTWTGDISYQNGNYAGLVMNLDKTATAVYIPGAALQGSDLSIDSLVWDDSARDGVVEGAEDVSLRVGLHSGLDVGSVSGTLSSSLGNMMFKGTTARYADIAAGTIQLGGYIYPGFPIFASQDNVIDLRWSRMNKGIHLC
jgi:hypothetical protein